MNIINTDKFDKIINNNILNKYLGYNNEKSFLKIKDHIKNIHNTRGYLIFFSRNQTMEIFENCENNISLSSKFYALGLEGMCRDFLINFINECSEYDFLKLIEKINNNNYGDVIASDMIENKIQLVCINLNYEKQKNKIILNILSLSVKINPETIKIIEN